MYVRASQSHVFVNEVDPCVWSERSDKSNYIRACFVTCDAYYRGHHVYDNYSDPLHWNDGTSER